MQYCSAVKPGIDLLSTAPLAAQSGKAGRGGRGYDVIVIFAPQSSGFVRQADASVPGSRRGRRPFFMRLVDSLAASP